MVYILWDIGEKSLCIQSLGDIYEYQTKYDDTCHTITHYHTLILYFASIDVYFLAWLNI